MNGKTLLSALFLALAASPVLAEQDVQVNAPTTEIVASEAFAKKLTKTYGDREFATLEELLRTAVEPVVAQNAPENLARVVVTIEDAQPNLLTRKQSFDNPSLDRLLTVSVGGARVSAKLIDVNGVEIGTLVSDTYDPHLDRMSYRYGGVAAGPTWGGARRSFDVFAHKLESNLKQSAPKA